MHRFILCQNCMMFLLGLYPHPLFEAEYCLFCCRRRVAVAGYRIICLVLPTDRPKSVRNRCVIEVFGCVCVLSFGFRIFCWYRGFSHRTGSDLLLFSLQKKFDLHNKLCVFHVTVHLTLNHTFDISVGVWAFVIGLGRISSFFS